ncbi:hypothetical protein ABAC460_22025 [Asticcacaulis sp. AC460]|uniref:c-type cytochrome n=1 Tax=Asticcacaulis sp. AC460 TaxID=1282360 RepID=UPI0003C3E71B|nr:c-type cytochrome [Asticcacaulis sp. AC460]ESQ86899.1 hypothetical protein ABAC460_22025 [Asticcacaulis sp. AC460]
MKGLWRIGAITTGGLVGLAAIAAALFFGLSQSVIEKRYDRQARVTQVTITPDLVAQGQHLSLTRGCSGCHGKDLRGRLSWEDKAIGRQFAANLTLRAKTYSDADFDRAIRGGVDRHGKALWDMPAPMYANLTDEGTAAVIAYIRSLPAGGEDHPPNRFGLGWRWEMVRDAEPHSSARLVDERKVPVDLGTEFAAGRYIAMTTCSECHGGMLEGHMTGEGLAPDLVVAAVYSDAEFLQLMRTGTPTGGRKLGLMAQVAQGRFSHFSDEEIAQLHAYLSARAEKQ